MNIERVEQETVDEENTVLTKVVLRDVASHCILTRLVIKALGRPGVDTDLEFFGSGDRWILMWTYPTLTLEATRALMEGCCRAM